MGSIPGSGKSPGEGNGHSSQYSCMENSMDRGGLRPMGLKRLGHGWVCMKLCIVVPYDLSCFYGVGCNFSFILTFHLRLLFFLMSMTKGWYFVYLFKESLVAFVCVFYFHLGIDYFLSYIEFGFCLSFFFCFLQVWGWIIIWVFCYFLNWTCINIQFPPRAAFAVSHRFWNVVFIFSFVQF